MFADQSIGRIRGAWVARQIVEVIFPLRSLREMFVPVGLTFRRAAQADRNRCRSIVAVRAFLILFII